MSVDPDVPPAALSVEVRLPGKLADVEPVRSVRTPIRLEYDFVPGESASGYLNAIADRRILGQRSPVDGAVFVPPRGVDPRHGAATPEYVELPDTGHVGGFCVTRLPIPGRDDLEIPYVSAWIHLDGADIGFLGLVAGIDTSEVRMGMRVRAVWKPDDQLGRTAENILYWEPTGEPDVPVSAAGTNAWHAKQAAAGTNAGHAKQAKQAAAGTNAGHAKQAKQAAAGTNAGHAKHAKQAAAGQDGEQGQAQTRAGISESIQAEERG